METLCTSQYYRIEVLKGGVPSLCRETQVSRTTNMSFPSMAVIYISNSFKSIYRSFHILNCRTIVSDFWFLSVKYAKQKILWKIDESPLGCLWNKQYTSIVYEIYSNIYTRTYLFQIVRKKIPLNIIYTRTYFF